ncbi:MAG: type II toxin-antitoxin system VapC family toxin [Roseimicrobium sp.]
MRGLLDTHAMIWLIEGDARLSAAAANAIRDPLAAHWFSMASYWEMCLKIGKGKLGLHTGWRQTLAREMHVNRISWLGIQPAHCDIATNLPHLHGDPFDRMLVAQAQREGLTIITVDGIISDYGVPVLW